MPAGYTGCQVCNHIGVMNANCRQPCRHYIHSGSNWEYCLLHQFIIPPSTCSATPGCNNCRWISASCKACYAITRGTQECTTDCPYHRGIAPRTGTAGHCSLLTYLNCPHYSHLNNSCSRCTY